MNKIEPQDPAAQSLDLQADNIAKLKALFPELLTEVTKGGKTEASINIDVLKALVGDATATDADEKYGLNWHGKRRARQLALTPSTGTLRPCPADSVDWDSTQNLMIEGDNLEVLKLLQKSYAGKVKLIYIDPPYNTGKDFVYPDNFQDNIKNYLELTGQVEGGQKLTSNPEASGRFHTDWLNMMYPRLKLARNLLRDDGVLLVSIDDSESNNLKIFCDEIFGDENYIGTFVINSTPNARDYGHIGKMHEYAHFYAKSMIEAQTNELFVEDKIFRFEDEIGGFNIHPLYNGNEAFTNINRPNLFFPIYLYPNKKINGTFFEIGFEAVPNSIKIEPPKSEKNGVQFVWRWGKPKCEANFNAEIIGYKTEAGDYRIVQKMRHTTKLIRSLQSESAYTTRRGTAENEELLGGKIVSFPKPLDLIQTFVQAGSAESEIVLDFFAGSGTTGHAVMAQNAADSGNRKYILVQLPEPLDPENKDQKTAADFCSALGKPLTIAELTKERLRRAGAKVKADNPLFAGDVGFRVFKLDTSNIRAWQPTGDIAADLLSHQNHLIDGRTSDDVLYELLLKLGLDLCVPIELQAIAGKACHSIGGGVLMACLAESITVADAEPLGLGMAAWVKALAPAVHSATGVTAVFRDSAFENDVAKSNLAAILAQHGVAQVRSL